MAMAMTAGAVISEVIESSSVLRLRGLPFEAKENDVHQFFNGFKLLHVHLCRRNGKTTGEAYVQLDSEEEGERARLQLDRSVMGRRYIEIFPAKEVELKKRRAWESQVTGYIVRMRGLPFNASHHDVQNFFMGIQISQNRDSILLTYNVNKRPSGEAFVEFPTEDARNEALKRDRKMIGHRYIELFPANKSDVDKALSQNRYNLRQGNRFHGGFLGGQGLQGQLNNMFLQNQNVGQNLDIADVLRGLSLGGSERSPNGGYGGGRGRGSIYPGGGGFQTAMNPFGVPPLTSQNQKLRPPPYGLMAAAGNAGAMQAPWAPQEQMPPVQQLPAGFISSQSQLNQEPLFPNPNVDSGLDPNIGGGIGDGMQPTSHLQPQQQQQQALLQQYMLEQQQQQQGMQPPIQGVPPMGLRPALYDPWGPPLTENMGGGRAFPIFNNTPHQYEEVGGDTGAVYFTQDHAVTFANHDQEHPATHAIPQYLGPGDAPPGMITPEEAAQY